MSALNAERRMSSKTLPATSRIVEDQDILIHVYDEKRDPVFSDPNVRFQVNQIEDFLFFHALAYCNIHGLWAKSLER